MKTKPLLLLLLLSCTVTALGKLDIQSKENPHRHSVFLKEIAEKVNNHPKSHWRAAVGLKPRSPRSGNAPSSLQQSRSPNMKRQSYSEYTSTGVDWRGMGRLALPEHQGSCGSCWAFAAVHTFVDNLLVRVNSWTPLLSVQHVLECCRAYSCTGCDGASDNAAGFDFLTRQFTVTRKCKEYLTKDHPCSPVCRSNGKPLMTVPHFKLNGFRRLTTNSKEIEEALKQGPLLAAIQIFADLYAYESGIYHNVEGPYLGYHSVEMVGYGRERGRDFWIIKNSWGYNWGENGYFRILAGQNEAQIEEHVIAPNLKPSTRDTGMDAPFRAPPGGTEEASLGEQDINEVGQFVAHEVNPFCRDGTLDGNSEIGNDTFTLERVLRASRQVTEGIMYKILAEVSLPQCNVLMYVDATIHLGTDRMYTLIDSQFVPPDNVPHGGSATACTNVPTSALVIVILFVINNLYCGFF